MKLGHRAATEIEAGTFRRLSGGPTWINKHLGLPLSGAPAWQSNGGPRNHSGRTKPYSLEISPPKVAGRLSRIHIIGVFALFASSERDGVAGGTITVGNDRSPLVFLELVNGRHYTDAHNMRHLHRLTGDGASIETVGRCVIEGNECRVDLLTLDAPKDSPITSIRFRDLGTPASFVIFDVFYEYAPETPSPFKGRGQVALSELPAVVRVGDRLSLRRALDQLEDVVLQTEDLDEAKGEALTFITMVIAAMVEMGAPKSLHTVCLEAARSLDKLNTTQEIATEARAIVEQMSSGMAGSLASPSAVLVDRALSIVNRNFAKNITDSDIADQLNLSTSHFRYLFKEVTGQPFHKYLIALRLERARKLLLEANMPVSEVAASVGFHGLAHFSRAFTQRFAVSPTNLRRAGGSIVE